MSEIKDSAIYLIDCDGVVCDWTGPVLKHVNASFNAADVTEWDVLARLTPEQNVLAERLCDTADFWRTLPILDGALEAIGEIAAHHRILFLSSPWRSCAGWEHARRGWLAEHFGSDLAKHFSSTPSEWKHRVSGDVLIDDKPETIIEWQKRHPGNAWLFHAPYNTSLKWPRRLTWQSMIFGGMKALHINGIELLR